MRKEVESRPLVPNRCPDADYAWSLPPPAQPAWLACSPPRWPSAREPASPERVGGTVLTDTQETVEYFPDRLVVGFEETASSAEMSAVVEDVDGTIKRSLPAIDASVIEVQEGETSEATTSLEAAPAVEYVEPEVLLQAPDVSPNDSLWSEQWGPKLVRAPAAWEATRGSASVVVAVVDTGVDSGHPDLSGALSGHRYGWSNYGSWVQVAAPGCNVAPGAGGGYVNFCGTSSASPVVSGIAGLAYSLEPTLSKTAFENALRSTAVPVGSAVQYGRANAVATLEALGLTPPLNEARPSIVGTPRVGSVLEARSGRWSGQPPSPTAGSAATQPDELARPSPARLRRAIGPRRMTGARRCASK